MKDHTYRPRRPLSIFGPACLAERETTGRRFCFDAAIAAFAKAVA